MCSKPLLLAVSAAALLLAAPPSFAQHGSTMMPPQKDQGHAARSGGHEKPEQPFAEGKVVKGIRTFELSVTDDGFDPARLKVMAGETVRLVVTRKTDATCAKEIVIKDKGIDQPLPLDKAVTVEFKADRPGEIRYACGMNHVSGVVFVN